MNNSLELLYTRCLVHAGKSEDGETPTLLRVCKYGLSTYVMYSSYDVAPTTIYEKHYGNSDIAIEIACQMSEAMARNIAIRRNKEFNELEDRFKVGDRA